MGHRGVWKNTMSTYTWIGGSSNNSATDPANWLGDVLPAAGDTLVFNAGSGANPVVFNANSLTATGNILNVAGPYDTLNFGNDTLDSLVITLGAGGALAVTDSQINVSTFDLASNTTLTFTGSSAISMTIDESSNLGGTGGGHDQQSQLVQTGTTAVINVFGTLSSNGFILADTAGASLTVNVGSDIIAPGTTDPGLFFNQGPILDLGESINIAADGNGNTRYANNGFTFIDGASSAASVTLTATQASISGDTGLFGGAHGATLIVNTNMPGSQIITFGDGNGVLQIDATTNLPNNGNTAVLADFSGRISGFQGGDVIELVGINPDGLSWNYNPSATYGNDVLQLVQNGTTIGLLRIGGQWVAGSGSIDASGSLVSNSTNFAFTGATVNGTVETLITLQNAISGGTTVTPTLASFVGAGGGATQDWGTAANWSGGSAAGIPGPYQGVDFALTDAELATYTSGGNPDYLVTVSSAETAGSVSFADPFATLDLTAPLTVVPVPGQSGGGYFTISQSTVEIASGGILTTSRLYGGASGGLTIDPGGSLSIGGSPSFAYGGGLQGIDIESDAGISGGTVTSAGNFVVGQNAAAGVTVDQAANVTVSYSSVGGQAVVNPFGSFDNPSLLISGVNTVYKDAGGDASTSYSGAMIVGGGMPGNSSAGNSLTPSSVSNGGTGYLQVDQSATLQETSFAALGLRTGAMGGVSVSNNAQWDIGTPTSVPTSSLVVGSTTLQGAHLAWLTVGLGGTGNLMISSGGTVALGAGEAASTFKIAVGQGGTANPGALGFIGVDAGRLDTGGGPLAIGVNAVGNMQITDGGTVVVASASATTGFGFGVVLGDNANVISGNTAYSSGQLTIGGGTGTSVFTDTGGFIDGLDGVGNVQVASGGSLFATGTLFVGGNGSRQGGDHGSRFNVSGGTATVSNVQLYSGNTLSIGGSGVLVLGNYGGTPTNGQLTVASLATLQGAGLVSVTSTSSSILNNGLVNANQVGGTLELNAVLTGSGTYNVAGASVLRVDQAVNNGVSVTELANSNATIDVLSPNNFNGIISGFYGNDTLDLTGLNYGSNTPTTTYAPNANAATGGTLTVHSAGGNYNFAVSGYHPGGFLARGDGVGGGTAILANDVAPCFAAGTRILTNSGEKAVEALVEGDWVPTLLGGGLRRVRWIGRTRIDLENHARPEKVAPIRVQAHAFAPATPHRDLVLSPDHAVSVEGTLIPIHLLVNGATIARLPAVGSVTYFHVELDAHDVLLAEGLPAESYLDTGNRGVFAGVDAARPLHPDLCADLSARAWDERACAPLLLGGPLVDSAHRRLAERAILLGHGLTGDPGLRVVIDGQAVAMETSAPGMFRVRLATGAREVRLISRSVVPQELDRSADDRRALGVAVTAIRCNGRTLALNGPAFGAGFHPVEIDSEHAFPGSNGAGRSTARTWRWTDGSALLRLPSRARPSVLELELIEGWRRYRDTHVSAEAESASVLA